jgi:uncharacterized repeat protein (TIGR01451 family)
VSITETSTGLSAEFPAIELIKSVNTSSYFKDQVVNYTYLITNIENVTLSNIDITDNITSINSGSLNPTGPLGPGAQAFGSILYTITQNDYNNGSVTNLGNATGVFNGLTVFDNDTKTITASGQNKALTITKTLNPLTYTDEQSVTYMYLITNTGNVTLSNIGVVDNLAGTISNLNVTTLRPGQ